MDKIKKISLISIVIFSVIVGSSVLFFNKCNSLDSCDISFIQLINPIILSAGVIGLVYGFYILKDFNMKIDKELVPTYKELIDDVNKEEKDDYKIICF